jgi:hypothetical protein
VNLFTQFLKLIPEAPLMVGDVVAFANGVATIEEPGGGRLQARGTATVGDRVYFRDGVIEGPAPDLPVIQIEV